MSVLRVSRKTDSAGVFDTSAHESRRERRPGSIGVLILVAGIVAGVGLRDTCPSALSVHIGETGGSVLIHWTVDEGMSASKPSLCGRSLDLLCQADGFDRAIRVHIRLAYESELYVEHKDM
jgi:hypothetical protein